MQIYLHVFLVLTVGLWIYFMAKSPGCHCLREYGWFDGGLDDAGVDSQDGENDAGQKDQSQLVDILHTHKHHRGHGGQQDGPIHPHVVQQGGLCLSTLQALQGKDGCFGCYVDLR